MKTILAIVLAALTGCASVALKRDLTDASGRVIGSVQVHQDLATTGGAAALLAAADQLERTRHDGDAAERAAATARASVDKGVPTQVSTRGGQVTSGYTGYYGAYGPYGMGAYPYAAGGYGPYGQAVYYPGASQETTMIEAGWRAGARGYLPPLGEAVAPGYYGPPPPQALAPASTSQCPGGRPPANPAEEAACNRRDLNELLRVHRK